MNVMRAATAASMVMYHHEFSMPTPSVTTRRARSNVRGKSSQVNP